MATSEALIKQLNTLLMLDHDAVEAYQQAISRIKSDICRKKLEEFQADHRRHVVDLKECIIRYDGAPTDRKDLKGFFLKGMTAIQSMAGDEMALKAMHLNERLTNRTYEEALKDQGLPEDVRALVQKNRLDEARHLDWVTKAIDQRLWESIDTQPMI